MIGDVEVIHSAVTANPWDLRDGPPPVTLRVPVRRVARWTFEGVYKAPRENDEDLAQKEYVLQNPDLPDPESSVPHAPHEVILLQAAVCRHQL